MLIPTTFRGWPIKCPKRVLPSRTQNPLIFQAEHRVNILAEKAYFSGRIALWHQITRPEQTPSREGVIIADTSGLVSLFLPNDHNHKVAVKAAKQLENEHKDVLIPAAVFIEFLNILGRKVGHEIALAAVEDLNPPFLVFKEDTNIPQALKKFEALPQSVSFTDCLVMATADEYATLDIFGFDKQFEDAGYTRLEPSMDWKQAA